MTTFPLMQNVALGVFSSLIMGVFMIPTLQTSMTSPCIFNVILMNRLRALDALVRTGLKGSMTTKRWNELIGEVGREYSRIHGACEMVNAENSSLLLIMLVGGGANIIFVLRTLLLVTLPANVISVMVFFMLISLRLMLSVATTSATVDSRSHRVASSISRLDPGADQSHLDVIDDHERVEVLLIHRRIQSMLHRYEYAPINIQIYHLLAITWGLVAEITSIAFTALIVLYNLSTGTRIEGA
ncbi:hypothetical protein PBRA_000335 [Plasmodiophora brassicae]|nr:hypothetical protein PBRA_000335 [Plasmodiophora brassicae]